MVGGVSQRAWLLMATGDNRGHAGNEGYDDQIDAYYSWDSKVPNHKNPRAGDAVALWDKRRLLGASVIEEIEIEIEGGTKTLSRCPECLLTRIQRRADGSWRCSKCHQAFAAPVSEVVDVILYRARYDAAWTSLDGVLEASEIPPLTETPRSINAIRELNWERFRSALIRRDAGRAVERLTARAPEFLWLPGVAVTAEFLQGHRQAFVRVRRGQGTFREHLLASQGEQCAFTGGAPARVLEAGHLYSYARLGEHHQHGGLMLRRDIHRLFDDGMLAVDPDRLRVDVAPELGAFPQYAALQNSELAITLLDSQMEWISQHWTEHRASNRV